MHELGFVLLRKLVLTFEKVNEKYVEGDRSAVADTEWATQGFSGRNTDVKMSEKPKQIRVENQEIRESDLFTWL